METHAGALCAALGKSPAANAAAELAWTSVWELNLQRPLERSIEDLISPHWAGISTLAIAPGCCGFKGPVPSATLDKRWWLASREILSNAFPQSSFSLNDLRSMPTNQAWGGHSWMHNQNPLIGQKFVHSAATSRRAAVLGPQPAEQQPRPLRRPAIEPTFGARSRGTLLPLPSPYPGVASVSRPLNREPVAP
jgi:hypothetical protein